MTEIFDILLPLLATRSSAEKEITKESLSRYRKAFTIQFIKPKNESDFTTILEFGLNHSKDSVRAIFKGFTESFGIPE